MTWIPGMSRPHFSIDSITFFSACSPNNLFRSSLCSKVVGARTTLEVFSFSVKNSTTESPEEPPGLATAGLWTDRAILLDLTKRPIGFILLKCKCKDTFLMIQKDSKAKQRSENQSDLSFLWTLCPQDKKCCIWRVIGPSVTQGPKTFFAHYDLVQTSGSFI